VTTQPDHATAVVTAHAVRHAASSLPERYRAVLVMREVEDLTYEAIGERLGMNENAVAQLLHRARKRLARELSATHGEMPLAA
jgi:RNA polymerase sigma-70 factor (ECF subfamily)